MREARPAHLRNVAVPVHDVLDAKAALAKRALHVGSSTAAACMVEDERLGRSYVESLRHVDEGPSASHRVSGRSVEHSLAMDAQPLSCGRSWNWFGFRIDVGAI